MIGKRGQAATELAIFGSIMLIIVGAMVNYGQTLATQQELEMYAFRRALQLSRARINDNGAARQVGFTVFKEVYPVNLLESGVAKSRISASASVDWESDAGDFDTENPNPTDFGTQYWQLGRRMIRDNQLIELPKMKVKRQRDETETRGFLEWLINSITGLLGSDDEIDVYESAPIEQVLTNKVTVSTTQDNIEETNGRVSTGTTAQAEEDEALTLLMQPRDKIVGPEAWDPKVKEIYEMPGDVAITQSEKVSKDKFWETP